MGPVGQGRPAFLDDLTRDRDRAFRDFYSFAWKLLTVSPPGTFRDLCAADREALISDVIFHCVKDDFRVLRTYRGGSFAGWLLAIARNRTLDDFRRRARRKEAPFPSDDPEEEEPRRQIQSREPLQDQRTEWSEYLECARHCISAMSRKCQILLWASGEGLRPQEIQCLLGSGPGSNKAISDDLRYCRERLKALLLKEGLDWSSLDSSSSRQRTC